MIFLPSCKVLFSCMYLALTLFSKITKEVVTALRKEEKNITTNGKSIPAFCQMPFLPA